MTINPSFYLQKLKTIF